MSYQESASIGLVREFCDATDCLDGSEIQYNDKGPSWDGYILVYPHHEKRIIGQEARVHVQIKGKESESHWPPEDTSISYPIEMKHLNNYFNDGGVLYIVVLCNKQQLAKVMFARILLPVDIHDLKRGKENQQSISISLGRVNEPKDLVMLCSLYSENRAKQSVLIKSDPQLNYEGIGRFELSFLPKGTVVDPVLAFLESDTSYVYTIQDGIHVPILGTDFTVSREFKYTVSCGDAFHDKMNVKLVATKDSKTLYIDNMIRVITKPNTNKFTINIHIYGKPPFTYTLRAAHALRAFHSSKQLEINKVCLSEKTVNTLMSLFTPDMMKFLDAICEAGEICNDIGIGTDIVTADDIFADYGKFKCIGDAMQHRGDVRLTSEPVLSKGIVRIEIGTKVLYVSYVRDDTSQYTFYNYLSDDDKSGIDIYIDIDGDKVKINKWLVVDVESIGKAIVDRKRMVSELETVQHPVEDSKKIWYALELIHSFDNSGNDSDLQFAYQLLGTLPDSVEKTVNIYQILIRQRPLLESESNEIRKLKLDGSAVAKCCACILLDQKEDFLLYYSELGSIEKEQFESWPIFSLAKQRGIVCE